MFVHILQLNECEMLNCNEGHRDAVRRGSILPQVPDPLQNAAGSGLSDSGINPLEGASDPNAH